MTTAPHPTPTPAQCSHVATALRLLEQEANNVLAECRALSTPSTIPANVLPACTAALSALRQARAARDALFAYHVDPTPAG